MPNQEKKQYPNLFVWYKFSDLLRWSHPHEEDNKQQEKQMDSKYFILGYVAALNRLNEYILDMNDSKEIEVLMKAYKTLLNRLDEIVEVKS